MVAIAKIVEYFKDLLLILCVFTTGKQVQRISGQRVRVRELSAKQANLIIDRSISSNDVTSTSIVMSKNYIRTFTFQSEVYEVKQDMMTIKSEIDSVQFVKDEIDDIRDSLDRLEAEGERRKAKLLEQVSRDLALPNTISILCKWSCVRKCS